jgi:hypothetical protein
MDGYRTRLFICFLCVFGIELIFLFGAPPKMNFLYY